MPLKVICLLFFALIIGQELAIGQTPDSDISPVKEIDTGKYIQNLMAGIPYTNTTESRWINAGMAYLSQNDLEDAQVAFNNLLAVNPNSAFAWAAMGYILNHKDHPNCTEALSDLKKAIKIEPNTAWYYNEEGNAYWCKGELRDALDAKEIALDLNKSAWFIWYDTAGLLEDMGRKQHELEIFKQALDAVNRSIELTKSNNDYLDYEASAALKADITNDIENYI